MLVVALRCIRVIASRISISFAVVGFALTALAVSMVARPSLAQVSSVWNQAAGDWNNPLNWTPNGVPANGSPLTATNGAIAFIDNGGTASITSAAGTTPTIDRLLFDGAAGGTVNQTSDTLTLTGLDAGLAIPATPGGIQMGTVALNAGATNNYNLNGTGAINAAGYVYIGQAGTAAGGLNTFTQGADLAGTTQVTIGAARLEIGGGQSATGGNGLYILDSGSVNIAGNGVSAEVGRVGTGALTAHGVLDINGGTFNTNSDVYLGRGTGSTGLIAQTGGTANLGGVAGGNLILGNGGTGTGTYSLSGGTLNAGNLVNGAGGIVLGNGSGGVDTLNISEPGGAGTTFLNAAAVTLGAAAGTTGNVTQTGGTASYGQGTGNPAFVIARGTYTLSAGTLTANGTTIGSAAGGIGTVTQTAGTATYGAGANNANFTVGANGGTGVYNYQGGNFTTNGGVVIGNGSGSNGTINQVGGTVTINVNAGGLTIGGAGTGIGTYNLSGTALNPGVLNEGGGLILIAQGTAGGAGTGTFNMGPNTTFNSGGEMWLGNEGTGVFNQNGGLVTPATGGGWTVVGNTGGNGTYNLHGGELDSNRVGIGNTGGGTGFFVQDNASGTGSTVNSFGDVVVGSGNLGTYTISGPSSGPNAVVLNSGTTNSLGVNGSNDAMVIGNGGSGTFIQNGGLVDLSKKPGINALNGLVILNGSYTLGNGPGSPAVLKTPAIFKTAGGTATFDFNGGVVQVSRTPDPIGGPFQIFMGAGNPLLNGQTVQAMTTALVSGGGVIVDSNGFLNVNISQNLSHDPALRAALDGGLTLADSTAAPGSLIISGSNTFTGDTNVAANATPANGLLILGSTLALGQSTLNMTIDSGPGAATPMAQFSHFDNTGAVVIGSFTLGGLKGASNLALSDNGGAAITLSVGNNGQNTTYTGVLSDKVAGVSVGSGVNKVGAGTLHLTANQDYTGPTHVLNGALSLNGASIALSSATTVGTVGLNIAQGPSTLVAQGAANAGAVTVGALGTFGAGDIAVANANSLTLLDSGTLAFTLGNPPPGAHGDKIALGAGALTLPTVGVANVNLADNANAGGLGSIGPGTYQLITAGSVANFTTTVLSPGTLALPGDTYIFTNNLVGGVGPGREIDVTIVAAKSWTGGAGAPGNWSNVGNWTGGIVPGSIAALDNPDTADFNAVSGQTSVVVDQATQNVRSITFEATASAYTVGTVGGNSLFLTNGGTIQTTSAVGNPETVNAPLVLEGDNGRYTFLGGASLAANTLNIGGGITGVSTIGNNTVLTLTGSNGGLNTLGGVIGNGMAGGTLSLYKTGGGIWVLGGANTFTGGVTVDAGTLQLNSSGALNLTVPQVVSFSPLSTGTLALNGNSVTVGGLNATTATSIVFNGSSLSSATLSVNSHAVANSFSGVLADGGTKPLGLTLSSDAAGGNLTLLNANTFSGDTGVTGAGLLVLGNANALQNSTLNLTIDNSVQFQPGLGPFTLGGLKGPGNLLIQDAALGFVRLVIGNNNQNTQYDGVLSEGANGAGVTKIGTGTLSLSQAPTYTFQTQVNGGTLAFDPLAGPGITFSTSQIAGTGIVAATGPGPLTLTNNNNIWSGGLVVSPGVSVTAGPFATGATDPLGTGAVTLNAGSTLNLAGNGTGTPTYRAPLTIAGDSTVNVTNAGAPSAATMGSLRIGARLSLTTDAGGAGSSLTLGKTTLTGPATLNPAANTTLNLGAIGETGGSQSLSMVGAGTATAAAPGTFTGGTNISNGTLQASNNSALGTNTVTMTGGRLQLGFVPTRAIGINFAGSGLAANAEPNGFGQVPASNTAGAFPIQNWNNAWSGTATNLAPFQGTQVLGNPGGGGFDTGIGNPVASTVVDRIGVPTAVTIAYNSPHGGWRLTNTNAYTGNQALLNGYIDVNPGANLLGGGLPNAATVSAHNVPYSKVDVYAYFGDWNGNGHLASGAVSQVPAGNPGSTTTPIYGQTNDIASPGGISAYDAGFTGFVQATGTDAGTASGTMLGDSNLSNYMLFSGVTPGPGGEIDFSLMGYQGVGAGSTNDGNNMYNVGLHGIEFVDATPGGSSATLANALTITANATVDVTGGAAGGVTGALTIGSNTLFVTGGSSGAGAAYTLNLGATTLNGNPTFDVANNGAGTGTAILASLSDGGTVRTITKANSGTLEIQGASTLTAGPTAASPGTSIRVNTGTLRFNNFSGAANIGAALSTASAVTVTVASGATLELAGSVSDLSDPSAATHRAHIVNNSKQTSGGSLLVSGTHQQVGAIDGAGDTVVNAGGSLTANHIIQNALVIGGTGASAGIVTIAASDASGNSLADSGGFALAGSLAPSGGFGAGTLSPSSLSAASGSAASGSSLSGSGFGGGGSSVPEPSTLLLLVFGSLAGLLPAIRRRGKRIS